MGSVHQELTQGKAAPPNHPAPAPLLEGGVKALWVAFAQVLITDGKPGGTTEVKVKGTILTMKHSGGATRACALLKHSPYLVSGSVSKL